MKMKSSVCALYNIRAYATPASNNFHVRPSLSRAVPELFLKISSAEGGLSVAEGGVSMLRRGSRQLRDDRQEHDRACYRVKYAC